MTCAPVILFCYKRPELLRQTLESLAANNLAAQCDLYVFADGPKKDSTGEQVERVAQVRKVILEKKWCRSVFVEASAVNKGLAAAVISGVSRIIEEFGKAIVIEDDVLLSPFFLEFMNEALDTFEGNDRVLAIGSWNYFCRPGILKSNFFLRYPDSIAWATTKQNWRLFEHDAADAYRKLTETGLLRSLNADGETDYFERMLKLQRDGKIDSWAIRWTATAILQRKLAYFPAVSLSKHMGFGAAATHEKSTRDYNAGLTLAAFPQPVVDIGPEENPVAFAEWNLFVKQWFLSENSRDRLKSMMRRAAAIPARWILHKLKLG